MGVSKTSDTDPQHEFFDQLLGPLIYWGAIEVAPRFVLKTFPPGTTSREATFAKIVEVFLIKHHDRLLDFAWRVRQRLVTLTLQGFVLTFIDAIPHELEFDVDYAFAWGRFVQSASQQLLLAERDLIVAVALQTYHFHKEELSRGRELRP